MKIVFVVPYPIQNSPSQRFRFEQYLEALQLEGHSYEIHSFLMASNWRLFASPGKVIRKVIAVTSGFLRRCGLMFRIHGFDRVFIHREAAPLGPPLFEWIIARVLKKKIIYDFDDAIWITDRKDESRLAKALRWRSKVGIICGMSHRISCGNAFLATYAREFNTNVVVNPTTIDTSATRDLSVSSNGTITIGWTGSHSTLKYLEVLGPVIRRMVSLHNISFCVIADVDPRFDWPGISYKPWSPQTELQDLLTFDIGLMPLPDNEWSRGKCGFKALQYMALGIPAVVSPVGVNKDIIEDGRTGLFASTEAEWASSLERLISDEKFRHTVGEAGRRTVEERYSVRSNTPTFLALFI
jgi:glycosyltransferase involved in cell wall biosynthesis